MELNEKEKIVTLVGAADTALTELEADVRSAQAHGKTPAKTDTQLLKSIHRALDTLKNNPFAGDAIPGRNIPKHSKSCRICFGWNSPDSDDYSTT